MMKMSDIYYLPLNNHSGSLRDNQDNVVILTIDKLKHESDFVAECINSYDDIVKENESLKALLAEVREEIEGIVEDLSGEDI